MMDDRPKLTDAKPHQRRLSRAGLRDYLAIARFDHMTKHVFIVPGLILGYAFAGQAVRFSPRVLLLGFASAVLVASANYALNEWLDRTSDAYHPVKSQRTAVHRALRPSLVYCEYGALLALGWLLAWQVGTMFFLFAAVFALSGIIYNVEPIRSKDRTFLDVISESINNPIRLLLGWEMVAPNILPPASLLITYWAGGAFLMGTKRLSEFEDIVATRGTETLCLYRQSFRHYTRENLITSCFFYAMLSIFFAAVFLVKYRIEYVVAMPFLVALFTLYLWLSFVRGSVVQRPERLFRSRRLVLLSALTALTFLALTFVHIPMLAWLSVPYLIRVH